MKLWIALGFFLGPGSMATAQEPQARKAQQQVTVPNVGERLTGVDYQNVEYLKFRQASRPRAEAIWDKFLVPAMLKAGSEPPPVFHMLTGEWDWIVFWEMKGGPADLEWVTDPSEARMMAALESLAGGSKQAEALLDEWSTLIVRSESDVAHRHSAQEASR